MIDKTKDKRIRDLLKETFEEYYLTKENKKKFLDEVAEYNSMGKIIYRSTDLREIAKKVNEIGKLAEYMVLKKIDDWFDNQSVKKDMKALRESADIFEKTAKDMHVLQQRLESAYEEMGMKLSKYFEIKEDGTTKEKNSNSENE